MQHFWLTATSLGLQVQPEMTPLIFSRYAGEARVFSRERQGAALAGEVREGLGGVLAPQDARLAVFLGRIGEAEPARARSVRRPLSALLLKPAAS